MVVGATATMVDILTEWNGEKLSCWGHVRVSISSSVCAVLLVAFFFLAVCTGNGRISRKVVVGLKSRVVQ